MAPEGIMWIDEWEYPEEARSVADFSDLGSRSSYELSGIFFQWYREKLEREFLTRWGFAL